VEHAQLQQLLAALVRLLPGAHVEHVTAGLWGVAKMAQQLTDQQQHQLQRSRHLQQLVTGLTRKLVDNCSEEAAKRLQACFGVQTRPAELFAALEEWGHRADGVQVRTGMYGLHTSHNHMPSE
jgi:hypothetical protein